MTTRTASFHLAALLLLLLLCAGSFRFFHSSYAVPTLVRRLDSDQAETRRHAAASLAGLGRRAKPAVQALLRLAQPNRSLDDRTAAVGALVEVSPASAHALIPLYTALLRHSSPRARYEAAMVLAELGPLGKDALPSLLVAVRDSDDLVRRWAVTAIGRIGGGAPDTARTLVSALDDRSEAVRGAALLALSYGFLGRAALTDAAPTLRRMSEDARYAGLAANALRSLEQWGRPDVELWVDVQALRSGARGTSYALRRLAGLGPAGAPAVPEVTAALADFRPLNRFLAAEALASIGPAAATSLPALRERLSDEDALVRLAAASAIAVITDSSQHVPEELR
jgi:HEAT repeat protein